MPDSSCSSVGFHWLVSHSRYYLHDCWFQHLNHPAHRIGKTSQRCSWNSSAASPRSSPADVHTLSFPRVRFSSSFAPLHLGFGSCRDQTWRRLLKFHDQHVPSCKTNQSSEGHVGYWNWKFCRDSLRLLFQILSKVLEFDVSRSRLQHFLNVWYFFLFKFKLCNGLHVALWTTANECVYVCVSLTD